MTTYQSSVYLKIISLFTIYLLSISITYSQNQILKNEIEKAIDLINNDSINEALPILEKYENLVDQDDLTILKIKVYLQYCYLFTNNNKFDIDKANSSLDSYLSKNDIIKKGSFSSVDELMVTFLIGVMNKVKGNIDKVVYYFNFTYNHYEINNYPPDDTYLLILNALSTGFAELGNYESAIIIGKKACEGNLKIHGNQSNEYLLSLNKLSSILSDAGHYKEELEISLIVVELGKVILGENSSEYLISLNDLASAYYNIGDYQCSFTIIQKVVNLRKELFGEKSVEYLTELYNLYSAYSSVGDVLEGLEIIVKVTELAKEIYGDKNKEYLVYLSKLAISYSELGNFKKANEIIKNVTKLNENITDHNGETFYQIQTAIASIYGYNEEYNKSIDIYLKLIEIDEKLLGENHPRILNSLSNIATFYWEMGEDRKSLEINKKVLELRKNLLGEKHPYYFTSLNNLSMSYSALGDYQNALEIGRTSFELRQEVLGEKHPNYISSLKNLAYLELDSREFFLALEHFIQSLILTKDKVIEYFIQLTEYQREQFWKQNAKSFNIYPLFLEKIESPQTEQINFAFDIALFTKGLLLNTTLKFDQLLAEKGTPEAIEKYQNLKLESTPKSILG